MPATAATKSRKPRQPRIMEIDAEIWAESGGTGGMYGALWRKGRIKIVSGLEPIPEITPAQRRAARRDKGIDLGGNDIQID